MCAIGERRKEGAEGMEEREKAMKREGNEERRGDYSPYSAKILKDLTHFDCLKTIPRCNRAAACLVIW